MCVCGGGGGAWEPNPHGPRSNLRAVTPPPPPPHTTSMKFGKPTRTIVGWFVSWCFEPSQPHKVTPELTRTMVNPSLTLNMYGTSWALSIQESLSAVLDGFAVVSSLGDSVVQSVDHAEGGGFQTQKKGSNERLFILTRTHSMHIFGEIPKTMPWIMINKE